MLVALDFCAGVESPQQQQQLRPGPCWRSKKKKTTENWTASLLTTFLCFTLLCFIYIYILLFVLAMFDSIRFDFVLISFEHNASQSQLSVYLHLSVTVTHISISIRMCMFTISFSVQHPLAFRSIWAWQVARSIWYVYMAHEGGKLICQ